MLIATVSVHHKGHVLRHLLKINSLRYTYTGPPQNTRAVHLQVHVSKQDECVHVCVFEVVLPSFQK